MCHKRKIYTSDLTDSEWTYLEALLPIKSTGVGRPLKINMREAVNGMVYIVKTGCQWANLPGEFPAYQSVYYHYRKWCLDGTWERVNRAINYLSRSRAGRSAYPSAGSIDSQSVKTTEVGGVRGWDSTKRVKGRKRHILVDTLGHLWKVVVQPANGQDVAGAQLLLSHLHPMLHLRLQKLWADGAYRFQLPDWTLKTFACQVEISLPPPDSKGFTLVKRRWVVERTFAWLSTYRRLSKDYEESILSSEGFIYLASLHTSLRRLAS
jgi:putative transposase